MADERIVRFEELALNDPNLGHAGSIVLQALQRAGGHAYGGFDNLIAVWQSNVTVSHHNVTLACYDSTQEYDNERLVQPILEHLIRNRIHLRKLTLSSGRMPQELNFRFIEGAAQNPSVEALCLIVANLSVHHFARVFA